MKKLVFALSFVILAAALQAQDSKQTFTRNVLVEQFTGNRCGYCPGGADRINQALGSRDHMIWITHHAGFNEDDLTNNDSKAMTFYFGGSTYAPAIMFDRTRFDNSNPGPVMSVPQVGGITTYFLQAKSTDCYCKIYAPEVRYDDASGSLSATISGRFGDQIWDENTRLIVYLVEDSLVMEQSDYVNGTQYNYVHNHTVRGSLTGTWGTPLTVDEQGNFSYELSYDLNTLRATQPNAYKTRARNSKLVAVVYRYNPANVNDGAVMNAMASAYLRDFASVGEVSSRCEARLFPNPATDRVVVEADAPIRQLTVCNALGQRVYGAANVDADHVVINTAAFAKGVYVVTLQTANGVATRQLNVAR